MTPNLDRLASWGVSFANPSCAAPACNPSRVALRSGVRPSTTGVYHHPDDYRPQEKTNQTLNWMKQQGDLEAPTEVDAVNRLWKNRTKTK